MNDKNLQRTKDGHQQSRFNRSSQRQPTQHQ